MNQATKAVLRKLAPKFQGVSYFKGKFLNLSNQTYNSKYYCMFFYPLDFTFVCPTEILEFNEKVPHFDKLNCGLVGCSIDSHFSHMAWSQKPRKEGGIGELNFPLLADTTKQISRDFGCLIEEDGVALRATYIVDDKGILRHASLNDLPVGRNVDEVLRIVEAFQYTDKHGEVCPASWKQGSPTMHADPNSQKTKEYWEKVHAMRK